ncbi:MAG: dethiobiotin synthase [Solirubrobacterales bacterium]|nr:dethiobiotin synthase [Solirubrobacterales bacterium]
MTSRIPGLLITGTDTGSGKSYLTAAIAAAMIANKIDVVVRKPLLTGLDDAATDGAWLDHDLLSVAVDGTEASEVISPVRFGPAVSPHLAAEQAGAVIDVPAITQELRELAGSDGRTLLVEGIGGLLVPITRSDSVADLAVALGFPVVIAARPGLGTISHCLLTLEAARSRGLDVRAVVFGPWPQSPSDIEADNLKTVAQLGNVTVATLPAIEDITHAEFAKAGNQLPLAQILAG